MNESSQIEFHNFKNNLSLKNKIARAIWNVTYILFYRPFISKIFNSWRIFVLKCFGAKIGKRCSVAASLKIWAPWNLIMHDYTLMAKDVRCYNVNKVILYSETVISDNVHLCTASHDIYSKSHPLITAPIVIKGQSWVAVDAFIGMGVTIGEGAVIGARAAVFRNVEAWTVVGGNPAKFIKKRELRNE